MVYPVSLTRGSPSLAGDPGMSDQALLTAILVELRIQTLILTQAHNINEDIDNMRADPNLLT